MEVKIRMANSKWLTITDDGRKLLMVCLGLLIIVAIHLTEYMVGIWLIEESGIKAAYIMGIIMAIGDTVAIGIIIVKVVFNIKDSDLDKIKTDDLPKPVPK